MKENDNNLKTFILLAGTNGSGKTTAFTNSKYKGLPFLNADIIQAELMKKEENKNLPAETLMLKAGRILVEKRKVLINEHFSFAEETTLSGKQPAELLKDLKEKGYKRLLLYIGLESVDLNISRVADRVEKGGHNIPTDLITSRYDKSLENLAKIYKETEKTVIIDNSRGKAQLIAKFENGKLIDVSNNIPKWATVIPELKEITEKEKSQIKKKARKKTVENIIKF